MPTFRRLLYVLAVLAVLLLLTWAALREPAQLVRVQPASRGPLTQSFAEEGKTRLKQRYVITAPVAGMLRRITLEAGDPV